MNLSIVFPAYNEELNIERSAKDALDYLRGHSGEIIIINDGSVDRTGEIIDDLARRHPGKIRPIHHAKNQGYAPTLRDGFLAAKSDWVFYTDSDNQFYLHELDQLLPLSEGADMVVGYRKDRQDPAFRKFAAGVYNAMVRCAFSLSGVRDIDCAFKLFRRDVFDRIQIESSHFLVDAEIIVKAKKQGMVIREIGVTHRPRQWGESTVRAGHVLKTLSGLLKLHNQLRRSRSP